MFSFSQFLKSKTSRIKNPIKLHHGSNVKLKSAKLPDKFDRHRAADGHGFYMTDNKSEASSYGEHLHHVHFHADHENIIKMTHPMHKQSDTVKKAFKKLLPNVDHKKVNKYNKPGGPELEDYHEHLLNKHNGDGKKVSKLYLKHNIHGSHGESITGTRKKPVYSNVYASYDPKRHVEIK